MLFLFRGDVAWKCILIQNTSWSCAGANSVSTLNVSSGKNDPLMPTKIGSMSLMRTTSLSWQSGKFCGTYKQLFPTLIISNPLRLHVKQLAFSLPRTGRYGLDCASCYRRIGTMLAAFKWLTGRYLSCVSMIPRPKISPTCAQTFFVAHTTFKMANRLEPVLIGGMTR